MCKRKNEKERWLRKKKETCFDRWRKYFYRQRIVGREVDKRNRKVEEETLEKKTNCQLRRTPKLIVIWYLNLAPEFLGGSRWPRGGGRRDKCETN